MRSVPVCWTTPPSVWRVLITTATAQATTATPAVIATVRLDRGPEETALNGNGVVRARARLATSSAETGWIPRSIGKWI